MAYKNGASVRIIFNCEWKETGKHAVSQYANMSG